MKRKDLIAGILLSCVSIGYLFAADSISAFTGIGAAPLTARFFPFVYGGALLLLSLGLIIRSLYLEHKSRKTNTQEDPKTDTAIEPATQEKKNFFTENYKTILTFVFLILYIAIMQPAGFILSTFIYLLAQFFLLGQKPTLKVCIFRVLLSAVLSVGLDFLFVTVLHVLLPKGLIGF